MSKKDRQHQQTIAGMKVVPDASLPPGTIELSGANGSGVRVEGLSLDIHNAEIDRLKAELEKERARASDEYRRAEEAMLKAEDLRLVTKAALHGAPPEGFEPKTAEGKEALEQVVLLGNIAKEQREDAVLGRELVARLSAVAGDGGTSEGAVECLERVITERNRLLARQDDTLVPATGWASDTARELVGAVPPHDRMRLLGDLLAQLLPHTGEQGQNETASDVLKRLTEKTRHLAARSRSLEEECTTLRAQKSEMSERMVKIQSAMVARRAPDAEAGRELTGVRAALDQVGWLSAEDRVTLGGTARALVAELFGLRVFFSEAPLIAVAVRDDGAKGPVRERYSLLVLKWDGKSVQTQVVEGTRPWGDIRPYLEQTVLKNLIPVAYR